MAEITRDHQERLDIKMKRTRGELPPIQVGDAIELKYTPEITIEDAKPIRGTVIAIKKKGIDSSFTIINYMDEEQFVATYPFNSPLLKSIRIMQKRRVTDGRRRVRQSRLYYLQGRPEKEYQVLASTMETSERQAERAAIREARRAGKVFDREAYLKKREAEMKKEALKAARAAKRERKMARKTAERNAAAAAGEQLGGHAKDGEERD
jgi:ribosomal protein L19